MSPDVLIAHVRGVEETLLQDITAARRRLEQLAPEVIELLREVQTLEDRVIDAPAKVGGTDAIGMAPLWNEVAEVTGCHELAAAASRLVPSYQMG